MKGDSEVALAFVGLAALTLPVPLAMTVASYAHSSGIPWMGAAGIAGVFACLQWLGMGVLALRGSEAA